MSRKRYSDGEYFVGHTHMHVPNKGVAMGQSTMLVSAVVLGTIHHGDMTCICIWVARNGTENVKPH
jgi:hypothetical protein